MKSLERTMQRRPDLLTDIALAKSQLENMYEEFADD